MSARAREAAANALLVVGSLATLFLLLEVAVRLFLPVADIPWHEGDPVVGYRLAPNQSGTWFGEGIHATYRINGSGFNNEHEYTVERTPGHARVAVLGDSYVEALYIDRGRRFFDVLEAGLRGAGEPADVFTYAVSGYGTGQELLLLQNEVVRDRPDLVILLWVSNDLSDTACAVSRGAEGPCFYFDDAGHLAHRPPRPHAPNRKVRLVLNSALARYVAINLNAVGLWRAIWTDGGPRGEPWTMTYARTPPPDWVEAWRVFDGCILEMARFCRDEGIPFLLVHQPIVSRHFRALLADVPGGGDVSLPARRFADLASRHGFRFFDLTPAFLVEGRIDPKRWINVGVGHWNPAAHEAAGTALVAPVLDLLGGAAQGVGAGEPGAE
ncbi:MAG TPA: SGNH/GDSL hydrolase family protein [Candidatus Polarisedimenticolia bacterium]|nr:SGNH/GDSL hydrolase family protein [Candidatus Polarisedimenticolia bacterium]